MAFTKTTSDAIQYSIDWRSSLSPGDFITGSVWSATGVTAVAAGFSPTETSVMVSGGTVGGHIAQNTITTNGGETIRRSITINVVENIPIP